jgi:hypothetical protein
MSRERRTWGAWQLYTGNPITLTCKLKGNTYYHIKLRTCQDPESREQWLKHIENKPWGDAVGLREAFEALIAEGMLRK